MLGCGKRGGDSQIGWESAYPHGRADFKNINNKKNVCYRKPNFLYIEFILAFDIPRKVYDGGGYDDKRPAAELKLRLVPYG